MWRLITALAVAILVATAGCWERGSDPSEEHNKALVRRWIEDGFNQNSLTVVDELFVEHFAVNGHVVGRAGLKESMRRHLGGFPDLHVTIDDLIADGQKVGLWYTVEGTHGGEFEGILPTGRHVKWEGFDLFTIEGGKIAHARFLSDLHGLLTQLDATQRSSRSPEGVRP